MKAVIVKGPGDPSVLKLKEIPMPLPDKDEVRIKIAYCALNPLDTHSRAARVSWGAPTMPYTPGYEYTGRIDSVGKNVDKSIIGKRVAIIGQWGGNAEYATTSIKNIIYVDERLSWKMAACYSTCGPTSWHLINSAAKLKPGEVITIHSAAGAVGTLTGQIAKSKGAFVIGLVGNDERAKFAEQYGFDVLINRNKYEWPNEVLKITEQKGTNIIIDGVAGPEAELNYKAIAPLGNIIYIGQMGGPPPKVNISTLIGKSFSVTGFVQFFHQNANNFSENDELITNIINGKWTIPIGKIGTLDDVQELHQQFEERKLCGRTLIKVFGEI